MPIKNQFNNKRIKIDTITGASLNDELGIFDETNNYSKNRRCFWNSKFYISNTAITGGDRGDLSNAPDVSTNWNLISSPPDIIYKNAIINSDMAISQRGTSFTSPVDYTLDRWIVLAPTATITQETSDGYSSLKVSQTGTNDSIIAQPILGRRLYDFVGKKLQLRFKVKSSKTGIFSITLGHTEKGYTAEYTINTANVEQDVEIEITALPLAQLNSTGNDTGLYLTFSLNASSTTSILDTWLTTGGGNPSANQVDLPNGGNWEIRDVQLIAGDVNLPYKKPSYYESLAECQRYFIKEVVKDLAIDGYSEVTSTYNVAHIRFPEMRTTPSVTNLSSSSSSNVSSFQQTVRSNSFVEPKIRNSSSGRYYQFGITFDLDAEL